MFILNRGENIEIVFAQLNLYGINIHKQGIFTLLIL